MLSAPFFDHHVQVNNTFEPIYSQPNQLQTPLYCTSVSAYSTLVRAVDSAVQFICITTTQILCALKFDMASAVTNQQSKYFFNGQKLNYTRRPRMKFDGQNTSLYAFRSYKCIDPNLERRNATNQTLDRMFKFNFMVPLEN